MKSREKCNALFYGYRKERCSDKGSWIKVGDEKYQIDRAERVCCGEELFYIWAIIRTIGFKPSIVIVFAQETATVAPVPGTLNHNVYFGIATESFGTLGISLTNSGFTVKSGQSHMLDDCIPCFNSAGISYSYIAIK